MDPHGSLKGHGSAPRACGPGLCLSGAAGQGRVPRTQLAGTPPTLLPALTLTLRGRSGRGCCPRTGRGAGGPAPGGGTLAAGGPRPRGDPVTLAPLLSPGPVTSGERGAGGQSGPSTPPSTPGGDPSVDCAPAHEAQCCWGLSGSAPNTRRGLHPRGLRGHGRPWCGQEHGGGAEGADARPRGQISAGFRSGQEGQERDVGQGGCAFLGLSQGEAGEGRPWSGPRPAAHMSPPGVSAGSEPVSPWARGQLPPSL